MQLQRVQVDRVVKSRKEAVPLIHATASVNPLIAAARTTPLYRATLTSLLLAYEDQDTEILSHLYKSVRVINKVCMLLVFTCTDLGQFKLWPACYTMIRDVKGFPHDH